MVCWGVYLDEVLLLNWQMSLVESGARVYSARRMDYCSHTQTNSHPDAGMPSIDDRLFRASFCGIPPTHASAIFIQGIVEHHLASSDQSCLTTVKICALGDEGQSMYHMNYT